MWASIIAVIGTLVGGILGGISQHTVAAAGRRDRDRQAQREAVSQMLHTATDYRREAYLKHAGRREGLTETQDDRRARYEARSRMTQALTTLRLADMPGQLVTAAEALVTASIVMGDQRSEDRDLVDDAGTEARAAHEALEATARRLLTS